MNFHEISLTPAQWVIVVVVLIAIVSGLKRLRPRKIGEQVTCPSCQKSMDRGRRFCPFCKEQLIKY